MDNRHLAVWDWLSQCSAIVDMYFNFSQFNDGDTVIVPMTAYKDEWADGMPYITGEGYKKYLFTVVLFKPFSTIPNNTENIDTLLSVQDVAQWVDSQNTVQNYPEFDTNCTIEKVQVLPFENGGLAGNDETGAKYMFTVQIDYYYRGV